MRSASCTPFHWLSRILAAGLLMVCASSVFVSRFAQAQTAAELMCEGLKPEIITQVDQNCAFSKLEGFPNSACYGSETTFFTLTTSELPSIGTVVALDAVQNIRTNGTGVAVLNVQPADQPDGGFYAILVGDAELEPDTREENTVPAYFIRTNTANAGCTNDVPSAVGIVNRSGSQTVNFSINGASITQGSTTIFRILAPGNTMQLMTAEGTAVVETDSDLAIVSGGNTSVICLNTPEDLGANGNKDDQVVTCGWTDPRPMTEEEMAFADAFVKTFNGELEGETSACTNGGETVTHIVRRGETLGLIAARYSTTVGAISAANKIADPNVISPGLELVIECAVDTGKSTIPPYAPTLAPPPVTR